MANTKNAEGAHPFTGAQPPADGPTNVFNDLNPNVSGQSDTPGASDFSCDPGCECAMCGEGAPAASRFVLPGNRPD